MKLININDKTCYSDFSLEFSRCFNKLFNFKDEFVIVCIGTDRSTGDSLGPIVGYKLKNYFYRRTTPGSSSIRNGSSSVPTER
ncbi:MAG: DUF1256 domain-containing protein [Thermoanaerobacterium sp.]|nr:DUF1256 domain-containing protein [Thermoanaerobacterium sp.]